MFTYQPMKKKSRGRNYREEPGCQMEEPEGRIGLAEGGGRPGLFSPVSTGSFKAS